MPVVLTVRDKKRNYNYPIHSLFIRLFNSLARNNGMGNGNEFSEVGILTLMIQHVEEAGERVMEGIIK